MRSQNASTIAGSIASKAVLEVDRRDRRLEHGSEDVPAARDALELVVRRVTRVPEQLFAEAELLRDRGAALAGHDVRTHLREPTLGSRAEAVEDGARDRELEDAVAEELEPLVRVGPVVDPRRMREHLLEALRRELRDQATELGRPAYVGVRPRRVGLSLGAR